MSIPLSSKVSIPDWVLESTMDYLCPEGLSHLSLVDEKLKA